jgi:Amt family ammonium transporter
VLASYLHRRKVSVVGAVVGAVAGLVAITPASGFVGPVSAILIGVGGGVLCFFACNLKARLGYDDSLDVVGVHGVGGTWGALATGLFASRAINEAGADGLFYGNPGQLGIQAVSVLATWAFAFLGSYVLLKVVDALVGLRVTEEEEFLGLDVSQHSENAYAFEVSGYGGGHSPSAEPAPRREAPMLDPAPRPAGPTFS